MSPLRTQVIIVGGGPVGMLLAAELAGHGVDTLVLETRAAVSPRPKATTLHARTVQTLVRRGHLPNRAPALAAGGNGAAGNGAAGAGATGRTGADGGAAFHFAGIPGLMITAPAAEPEPILKIAQADLERRFEQRARAAGARVLREHRVTGLVQGPDGVRVTARGPRGPVTCDAAYLVGADGARSTVRDRAGIGSRTHPATVSALTGRITPMGRGVPEPGWHLTARGWITVKEDPGGAVHIRTLNCAGPSRSRGVPPTLEEFRREVSWIAGRDLAMTSPRWLGRFSDLTRLADTFRAGRVFLVGDAAHVHFPVGGQGLSTGLSDALNLGWKLAFAVRGEAAPGLLDSYDAERRPAARRVIDNTRAQLALMRPGPEVHALRTLFGAFLEQGGPGGCLSGMISAQDTVLPTRSGRRSAWEGRFLRNTPVATASGETDLVALLRDGRLLLLLFGEDGDRYRRDVAGLAGTVRVVQAKPSPDAPCDALLVRPDGYVAWASGGDGLPAALSAYVTAGRAGTGRAPAPRSGFAGDRPPAQPTTDSARSGSSVR